MTPNREPVAERWLARVVPVRPEEVKAIFWSFAYFFALLAGYYVLRPVRDEMGIAGGVRNLPWMFTATFVALLVAQAPYGALVARLPRRRFIPLLYHFFTANIAIFWLLFVTRVAPPVVARIFFVWISLFGLFAVSVFWSFMADLFTSAQGKRLFGFIGAGGTAGGLLGPLLAFALSVPIGPVNLLLVAALFLEIAVFCASQLIAATAATAPASDDTQLMAHREQRIGGSALNGLIGLARSPYLLGIALWVSLLSFAGTFFYFEQAHIVAHATHDPALQTRVFAGVDVAVGILTLATQGLATGRLINRFGPGKAAAALPAIFCLGFAALALAPTLAAVIAFQALQRTTNFAIANPARQIFFTVVGREEKYKVKSVVDLVVFRGSDALFGWLFESLRGVGLELGTIAAIAVPVVAGWLGLALALGRGHDRRAALASEPALGG